MTKIIAVYIVENDEDVMALSLKSVLPFVDKVVIVDGNQDEESSESLYHTLKIENLDKITVLHSPYPHHDIGANGKQRNVYMDYLKEHHEGDIALVVDADEVVTGIEHIKTLFNNNEFDCYDCRMYHFIGDLGSHDSELDKHYVPRRLFRITQDISYPEKEHVTPSGFKLSGKTDIVEYYHLGYAREVFSLHKKYKNHLAKSNIHTPEYLQAWYINRVFGKHPVKPFPIDKIPDVMKEHLDLKYIDEIIYFMNRKDIETKHFLMVNQWGTHFQPSTVADIGCGMAHYLYAWSTLGVSIYGLEKSQFACQNNPYKIPVTMGDITAEKLLPNILTVNSDYDSNKEVSNINFDLVTVLDVLEHISYDKIDIAIENIKKFGKRFLFSIPYKDDPHYAMDDTHIIGELKEWWIHKFAEHGIICSDCPNHFAFKEQMMIGVLR